MPLDIDVLLPDQGMSIDHDTLDKLAERWRDRTGRWVAGSETR
jgi:hypothetical protein